jgi:Mg2+ and Co2+ transporter CorA
MKRDVDSIMAEFRKRLRELKNVHTSITHYCEQVDRFREGVTSFETILEAEQNANIYIFTWITVMYLPLTFVASIFSMGHDIIPLYAGRETFGWLTAAFLLGTFAIALCLRIIVVGPVSRVRNGTVNLFKRVQAWIRDTWLGVAD